MDEHLTDSQILALAAEQQTAPEPSRQHVADCSACRDKLAELRATWLLLGCWRTPEQLQTPSDSWQAALLSRVRQQRALPARWRPVILRAAASVLIAFGLGLGAAWYSAPTVADDSSKLAAGSLYLEAFSANRSVDLETALGAAGATGGQP